VDYSQYNQAMNPANSPIARNARYWSSTTLAYKTDYAWGVSLDYGIVSDAKSNKLYARAVRGGQTPAPTSSPAATPFYLKFNARPISEINIEKIACTDIDLRNLIVVLKSASPPSGVLTFYSSIFYYTSPEKALWYFSQKDIINRIRFIQWEDGEYIKAQSSGVFPSNGSWENDAFKQFFENSPVYQCGGFVNSGYIFLIGFAPNGNMSQFQGAAFTFGP
jgi:hypothetical protein